jgi:transcriptional regulator with XRE-family HTH domain
VTGRGAARIGLTVRAIRRRRGLSLEAAAGLAGISRSYLAMLERGERRFDRRGLLEDLAGALGCAVVDLTGQPYPPADRAAAQTLASLGEVSAALYDSLLTAMPADPARPVRELVQLAAAANRHTDETRYSAAVAGLGAVLTELHIHAVHTGRQRRHALAALIEACWAACGAARQLGRPELAVHAAQRAAEAARELESEPLMAFTAMSHSGALARLGARRAAGLVIATGIRTVGPVADPTSKDTACAEGLGMLHLASAQVAAREGRGTDADTHLDEARQLAARTGERNAHLYHFGPANVTAWHLAIAVELQRGPSLAATLDTSPTMFAALDSADRRAGYHLELARAWAQSGGDRDALALRHLDAADVIAPQRLRNDPIARELVAALDTRIHRRSWELDSLRYRFGLAQRT